MGIIILGSNLKIGQCVHHWINFEPKLRLYDRDFLFSSSFPFSPGCRFLACRSTRNYQLTYASRSRVTTSSNGCLRPYLSPSDDKESHGITSNFMFAWDNLFSADIRLQLLSKEGETKTLLLHQRYVFDVCCHRPKLILASNLL